MAVGLAHLGALLLVAVVTNLGLRLLVAYLVLTVMNPMAVRTRYPTVRMRAGRPEHVVAALVASPAGSAALLGSGRVFLGKADIHFGRFALVAAAGFLDMFLAVPVTARTRRSALVCSCPVTRLSDRQLLRRVSLVVTLGTFGIALQYDVFRRIVRRPRWVTHRRKDHEHAHRKQLSKVLHFYLPHPQIT